MALVIIVCPGSIFMIFTYIINTTFILYIGLQGSEFVFGNGMAGLRRSSLAANFLSFQVLDEISNFLAPGGVARFCNSIPLHVFVRHEEGNTLLPKIN